MNFDELPIGTYFYTHVHDDLRVKIDNNCLRTYRRLAERWDYKFWGDYEVLRRKDMIVLTPEEAHLKHPKAGIPMRTAQKRRWR